MHTLRFHMILMHDQQNPLTTEILLLIHLCTVTVYVPSLPSLVWTHCGVKYNKIISENISAQNFLHASTIKIWKERVCIFIESLVQISIQIQKL